MTRSLVTALIGPLVLLLVERPPRQERSIPAEGHRDWKVYGGGAGSIRHSARRQISRFNIRELQVAWTFDRGDAFEG